MGSKYQHIKAQPEVEKQAIIIIQKQISIKQGKES